MTRQNTTVQQTPLLRNSMNYQAFVQPWRNKVIKSSLKIQACMNIKFKKSRLHEGLL